MSASSAGANLVSCNASGWVRTRNVFPFQIDAHIWTSIIIVIYQGLKETKLFLLVLPVYLNYSSVGCLKCVQFHNTHVTIY